MDEFREAYIRFYDYLGISKYPITYDVWNLLPFEQKGAALYVNFYDTINLARYKVYSVTNANPNQCDGLSALLDRISRVAPVKIDCAQKFTAAYIYQFSSTTMGSKARARGNKTMAFHTYNLVSNVQFNSDGTEFNLYDLSPESINFDSEYRKYLLDELYCNGSSEVQDIIDAAIQKGKVPKRLSSSESFNTLKLKLAELFDETA